MDIIIIPFYFFLLVTKTITRLLYLLSLEHEIYVVILLASFICQDMLLV
jgi:hypothetical protein